MKIYLYKQYKKTRYKFTYSKLISSLIFYIFFLYQFYILYIKTEKNYIAILNNIFLTFHTNKSFLYEPQSKRS